MVVVVFSLLENLDKSSKNIVIRDFLIKKILLSDMCSRVKLTLILIVLACIVSAKKKIKFKHGPSGMSFDDTTNCTEFSKHGRFNPYSVLNEKWFVFYYWAPVNLFTTYVFTAPSANHTRRLKKLLDGNCILPVMWHARQVLLEDNEGYISLLVERSDRGEYWLYPVARVKPGQKITPRDIRLKQTGDNRILGIMDCAQESLLVMSRMNDVPRQRDLYEVASRLGYRGRSGRSYLYQGHEWGPVGEADEEIFWDRRLKKDSKDTSKENKSSEENSEEVEFLPMNKPEKKKNKAKNSKTVSPPIVEDPANCVKVLPELWNDPKPNPNPDNLRITKEELNDLDTKSNLTTDAPIDSPNNKQENNNLNTELENMQKNDKPDNYQEIIETEIPLDEQKNLESNSENPDPDKENCVVCYKSKVSYMPAYIYDIHSITNLNNNGEEPTTEVPFAEIPHDEVPRTEVLHAEVTSEDIPRPEVPYTEVPSAVVPDTKVTFSEKPYETALHPEVPHVEVTSTKALREEATGDEVPRLKVKQGKLLARQPGPEQVLTNSSEILILTPKTHDG